MSDQLTPDAAVLLGRAESRWLEQARLRLRRDQKPAETTTAGTVGVEHEETTR